MTHVVILGAGAIGLSVGAVWSAALVPVGGRLTLVGRASTLDPLGEGQLQLDGRKMGPLELSADARVLASADLIVLAMKAHSLDAAMTEIAEHARADVPILSLLNGLDPVRRLKTRFPARAVLAGMVPFNVVWSGSAALHTSGTGAVALERAPLTEWIATHSDGIELHDDLAPVQCGKLLLNLVGAVNALSGLPLYDMLSDRNCRRVYAACLSEALDCYKAADIPFKVVGPTHPRVAIAMLRAPNWLFQKVVLKRQNLNRGSMTSLAGDLLAGRPTEIDTIHGEIVRLGAGVGLETPVNSLLVRLVQEREGTQHWASLSGRAMLDMTQDAMR